MTNKKQNDNQLSKEESSKDNTFDLIVIGAGSGGVRAARTAASLGAKVAIVEERYLGGTCVNVGCVPKKLMVFASDYAETLRMRKAYGWQSDACDFTWQTLRDNVAEQVQRLNDIYQNLLEGSGVQLFEGKGSLKDARSVIVEGQNSEQVLHADRILLATGGWPNTGRFEGHEHCVTSNEIFSLEQFPKRILILGGGYIAAEFSCIFQGLGSQVELVFRQDRILKSFDEGITRHVMGQMKESGINCHAQESIERVEKDDDSFKVTLLSGKTLEVDCVLAAIGRHPKTDGLGLEHTIVIPDPSGHIEVNENFETNEDGIYAIGDLVGNMDLTPVALNEGMYLARHLFDKEYQFEPIDYDKVATAIFTRPNIGVLGMTEEQARESCEHLKVFESTFRPMKTAFAGEESRSMLKILVDGATDKVLGIHAACPDAGEIIQGFAVAYSQGVTKAQLDRTIGIHPTLAEELVTLREERDPLVS